MTIEELKVLITAETKGLKKELEEAKKQFASVNKAVEKSTSGIKSAFKKITATIAVSTAAIAAIIAALVFALKEPVKAAMTVESAMENINRMMGTSAREFEKWAQTQARAYGMAREDAYKYGNVYSNLISSFASGTKETQQYTVELLQASAVVASKTGRTIEDTMERIRSGLLGNTEAIEDLGINVNVAMLESSNAFAKFANGRSWDQLTFQQQQQIRLTAILEQAYTKYGDTLANTTATKQMMFIATLKDIRLNLGQAFLPIYNAVLPPLTALAEKISQVTARIAQFMQALFGKARVGKVSIGEQTDAINAQTGAVEGLGNAADAAGKKAKKAQGSLAGFDEINTLNKVDASGSRGGGGGSGGSAATELLETEEETEDVDGMGKEFEKLVAKMQPTIDAFNRLKQAMQPVKEFASQALRDFYERVLVPIGEWTLGEGLPRFLDAITNGLQKVNWDAINAALNNLWSALTPFSINVGEGLLWFWENVLVPLGTWVMNEIVPRFLDILAEALRVLNGVIEALKPLAQWLWDKFLLPLAQWTGGVIVSVLDSIKGALEGIGNWIKDNQSMVTGAAITIASFFLAWKTTQLMAFISMSGGVTGAIASITTAIKAATVSKIADKAEMIALTTLYAKDLVVSIAKGTTELIKQSAQWVIINAHKITATAAQIALTASTAAWNAVAVIATGVTAAFGSAVAFLTSPIGLVVAAITAVIAISVLLYKNWDEISAKLKKIWETIKTEATKIWDDIKTKLTNTWELIKDSASNIWNALKDFFKKWGDDLLLLALGPAGWAILLAKKLGINWNDIKTTATNIWNGLKSSLSGTWNLIKSTASTTWNNIKTAITSPIENAKKTVGEQIEKIKKFFNFNWSLPKLELPHFNIKGKFSLDPPQVPKLSVNWYAKGGIFDGPSIIGVGEAGAEAVVPIDRLTGLLAEALRQVMGNNPAVVGAAGVGGGDTYVYIGNEQVDAYIHRSQDRRNSRSNGR